MATRTKTNKQTPLTKTRPLPHEENGGNQNTVLVLLYYIGPMSLFFLISMPCAIDKKKDDLDTFID
jgi:hypothetical protein